MRGEVISTRGFRLRTQAPGTLPTIAAFGRGAVKVAARYADRMVINLVTPKSAARLVEMLHDECRAARRPTPPVAVWLATVVDPSEAGMEQLPRNPLGKILKRELRDELRNSRHHCGSAVARAAAM